MQANLKCKNAGPANIPWFLIFAVTLWFLWKWRCSGVFNPSFKIPNCTYILIIRYCREWLTATAGGLKNRGERCLMSSWKAPCKDWVKINVDGGMCSELGLIYAGGLIRGGLMASLATEVWVRS
ncbi:hypothetical protein ACOSQ3_029203 [Xanthoceras sorbifolium]